MGVSVNRRELLMNIAGGVGVAAVVGAYGFLWTVNNRLTRLENSEDEAHTRSHAIIDCKMGVAPECQSDEDGD